MALLCVPLDLIVLLLCACSTLLGKFLTVLKVDLYNNTDLGLLLVRLWREGSPFAGPSCVSGFDGDLCAVYADSVCAAICHGPLALLSANLTSSPWIFAGKRMAVFSNILDVAMVWGVVVLASA